MRQKNVQRLRRLEALVFAALVVWAAAVTAGSATASAAGQALLEALPLKLLRWELGDRERLPPLSPAVALAVGESPLLLSARADIAALEQTEARPPEEKKPAALPEESLPAQAPDNGVPARTLVPRDPSGYAVFGSAYISSSREGPLSLSGLDAPFSARLSGSGPQVLILHTHGSEAYTPADPGGVVWSGNCRSTDARYSVVRVGDVMADAFSQAGVAVLHDRTLYDYPEYNGSYDRSLEAIQRHLSQHPSIRFVLDIHRDAIEDSSGKQYKVVSEVEGEGTAAQLTLVVGSDGGGLSHPDWMENLRLAVALQQDLTARYPTLMRPILLRNSRYNQHTSPGALLVEVGAAGNSPEEAVLGGRLFAERMAAVLLEKGAESQSDS